jgi:regulatory protein
MQRSRSHTRGSRTADRPSGAAGDAGQSDDERVSISESAWRLLAYRARSRQELRDRLLRKGFQLELVDAQLDHLAERGYLDDEAFAQSLVAARQSGSNPRGTRALQFELRQKGVDKEIATAALAAGDDADAAYRAALKRAGTIGELDYREFSRRLLGFLQRRGFGYDVARSAVEGVWQERNGAPVERLELC